MIQLLEHFTYKKLIRFTIPTVAMMIFTSVYGVVDGLFVSNVAGSESFAGVNLIMPALMMLGSVGFMIGTGGSALVSKTIGEGNKKLANRYFSMLIYFFGNCEYCFSGNRYFVYKTNLRTFGCRGRNG